MTDFYLGERVMQLTVAEEHRRAELRRLRKQTGAGRKSWLARQRYRSLSWLGSTLISAGVRLLHLISTPHPGTGRHANHKA